MRSVRVIQELASNAVLWLEDKYGMLLQQYLDRGQKLHSILL